MKLFTSAKRGLDIQIAAGAGDRDISVQTNFRKALIEVSQISPPEAKRGELFCAITDSWQRKEHMKAAHIFPYSHGEEIMSAIFGQESGKSELFSPVNGIMMLDIAEEKFDKGYFVIIPLLPESATGKDIQSWHDNNPKDYMIRVINPNGKSMNHSIHPSSNKTWNDLDGQKVQFKGNHRPQARYLYFHYCRTILRRSWLAEQEPKLKDQLGKLFWGTPGPYIKKTMLLAFIEEMGHEYEALLEGAFQDNDEASNNLEADPTALLAATKSIRVSNRRSEEVDFEDQKDLIDDDSSSSEESEGDEN